MTNPYAVTGTNAKPTFDFLLTLDNKTFHSIMDGIASNYGITADEAYEEVTHPDAEHLLDYITVNRSTVSLYYNMWSRKNRVAS